MNSGWLIALGICAALLQIAGYSLYIRNFIRQAIRPNAASFMMFSYGTSLLAFLEWRNSASLSVLLLPVVCAAMGIVVAAMCLRKGATERIDLFEAVAFTTDLWLTIIYAYFALGFGDVSRYVAFFLIVTNLTTISCFMPLIRSTWISPARELPGPWMVWAGAYSLLCLVTWGVDQGQHPVLLIYPMMNAVLHALIAVLSLRKAKNVRRHVDPAKRIFVDHSKIEGLGIFATRGFVDRAMIWKLEGKLHHGPKRTEPNWIGIGPDCWIDPKEPLDSINHSCEPNAAFGRHRQLYALRDIARGEEITIDYSTTEADPKWTMECHCKAPSCRRGLCAIQISFADRDVPPPASPLMQRVWAKRRVKPSQEPAFPQLGVPAQPGLIAVGPYAPVRRDRTPSILARKQRERLRAAAR
jgi:SET domain